jgi:L-amino acid N-acyltransferase YncA
MNEPAPVQTEIDVGIRPVDVDDADPIARIYNHYVLETVVTFEEQPVTASEMARRIEEIRSHSLPFLLAESDDRVVGYAHASPWKGRCAYRFSTEVTVYLAPDQTRRGIGTRLYRRLLEELRDRGIHTALGGIALPNDASVTLHERLGFQKVAHFREVGFKFGRWVDVGYWQIRLEPDTL